jgi:predicted chitinase
MLSYFIFNDLRLLTYLEILEELEYTVLSAIWFWHIYDLTELADRHAFVTKAKEVIK